MDTVEQREEKMAILMSNIMTDPECWEAQDNPFDDVMERTMSG